MLRTGAAVIALAFALGAGAQQPPAFELEEMTIARLQEAMTTGKYTARQLVELYSRRIEAIDLVNGDHFIGASASPAAIAGYPNITVPAGEVEGLPIGLSFFGRRWSEAKLIGYAYAFEQATRPGSHRR